MTISETLIKLFERDLDKLAEEMTLYQSENSIWALKGDIKNTAGHLCLHLCGNLQHYIGHVLGGVHYVRNRPLEFSARNIPQHELLALIQQTRSAVVTSLQKLSTDVLLREYPEKVFDYAMTTQYFLIHLHGHLNYHLGQINYHRRLLDR